MKMTYCPDCGTLLEARELGDEGMVPWCPRCSKPWFDIFPVAVIGLVHDGAGNVLLLRQGYISDKYCNLVSGYMKPGERAEETMVREILEETGQQVEELHCTRTNWFGRKEMLMVGFVARVVPRPLQLSVEVDSAQWVAADAALSMVHPYETSTSRLLVLDYLSMQREIKPPEDV